MSICSAAAVDDGSPTSPAGTDESSAAKREGGTNREYSGLLTKSIRVDVNVLLQELPMEVMEESRTRFSFPFLLLFFFPLERRGDLRGASAGVVSMIMVGDSTGVEDKGEEELG